MAEKSDFTDGRVSLYNNGILVSQTVSCSDVILESGQELLVGNGGSASAVSVGENSLMRADSQANISLIDVYGGTFSGGGVCSDAVNWYGAAICSTNGTVEIADVVFCGNTAAELNGYSGCGGAVETYFGTLDISGGIFSGNTAAGATSAGGAVCTISTSVTVTGGVYDSNSAFYGGAMQNSGASATLDEVVFTANSADCGGALEFHGGVTADVLDCFFSGNTASCGGALYNDTHNGLVSTVTVSGGTFSGNAADNGGAVYNYAVLSVENSAFVQNRANGTDMWGSIGFGGAAVNTAGGTMTVSGSLFCGNCGVNGGAIANSIPYGQSGNVRLSVSGSTVCCNSAANGGGLYNAGAYGDDAVVTDVDFYGNTASYGGGAVCNSYGDLNISGGTFSANHAGNDGGALALWNGGTVSNAVFTGNSALYGGAVSNSYSYAKVTISGSVFTGNTATSGGGALWVDKNSAAAVVVENSIFSGNSSENGGAVLNEKTLSLCDVTFVTSSDTVVNVGKLILCGENYFGGGVDNENGEIVFDLTTAAVVNDISNFTGGLYTLAINSSWDDKSWIFAGNAEDFAGVEFKLTDAFGVTLGSVSTSMADDIYSLVLSDGKLEFRAEKSFFRQKMEWQQDDVILEISTGKDFNSCITVAVSGNEVDILNLASGTDLYYRTINGENVSDVNKITGGADGVEKVQSCSLRSGVFFAEITSDTWSSGYSARHRGTYGNWAGTGEKAVITGKNIISDIFSGREESISVLYLSDTDNGDALFIDDIYTAAPEEMNFRSRLANLNMIYAGAGDDVIDMTSKNFAYCGGGISLYGGKGNDVLWANETAGRLFGDSGDDRLVGGGSSDIFCGGSGDDSIFGGGGDDIFCFCQNWGNDIIGQLGGGSVTLYFAENITAGDLTFSSSGDDTVISCGDNTIRLESLTADEFSCVFAPDNENYTEYAETGAFSAFASDMIFSGRKNVIAQI